MSDYKAIVASIDRTVPIAKADKIHIAFVMGESVIVTKDWKEGMVGIFFPAETQLSEEFCKQNSLFRDAELNVNPEKTGFFEPNRRVRCQKFLGVASEGFFCEVTSLDWTGFDTSKLKVGDSFAELNGKEVAKKYVRARNVRVSGSPNRKKPERIARKHFVPDFHEHTDTGQFKYNLHKLKKGDLISIQAKGHGTSGRSGILPVFQPLTTFQKFVNKLFKDKYKPSIQYEEVVGTRRVVLEDPNKQGFHGSEQFRFDVHNKIAPFLKDGMTVYYEIVGYANGKPIMPKHNLEKFKDKKYTKKYGKEIVYKYGCVEGTFDFYIYRITYSTVTGDTVDLTQPQLVAWCEQRGLKHALDVVEPFVYDGDEQKLRELVEELTERPDQLTEDYRDPSIISEGVVVRVDRETLTPLFLKSKSFVFKVCEGIAKETEDDIEDLGGVIDDEY